MERFTQTAQNSIANRRDESARELNNAYRDYLETCLIYKNVLNLANRKSELIGDLNSPTRQPEDLKLDGQISDLFWKSFVQTNTELANDKLSDKQQQQQQHDTLRVKLSQKEIEHLVDRLQETYEEMLIEIQDFVKPTAAAAASNVNVTGNATVFQYENVDDDLLFKRVGYEKSISCSSKFSDLESLMNAIGQLANAYENKDSLIESLNEELSIKLDHCMNISKETLSLMKRIFSDLKLEFYCGENRLICENNLIKCKTLLAKINLVSNEIMHDLYSSDKLKSLKMISNQLKIDTTKTKEKYELLRLSLDEFKSLDKDYEELLNHYLMLKKQLDEKTWTLNKLSQDMDIEIN